MAVTANKKKPWDMSSTWPVLVGATIGGFVSTLLFHPFYTTAKRKVIQHPNPWNNTYKGLSYGLYSSVLWNVFRLGIRPTLGPIIYKYSQSPDTNLLLIIPITIANIILASGELLLLPLTNLKVRSQCDIDLNDKEYGYFNGWGVFLARKPFANLHLNNSNWIFGGLMSVILTQPFDVISIKQQTDKDYTDKYWFKIGKQIWETEGMRGFADGLLLRIEIYFARLAFHFMFTQVIIDKLRDIDKKKQIQKIIEEYEKYEKCARIFHEEREELLRKLLDGKGDDDIGISKIVLDYMDAMEVCDKVLDPNKGGEYMTDCGIIAKSYGIDLDRVRVYVKYHQNFKYWVQ